ncbi:MAG: hypothetical protein DMF78_11020 [Acidobacteria bacterium]|nr:MAG: hypothetical protein DMF78_11020 [Acidobacteriota bacterium]
MRGGRRRGAAHGRQGKNLPNFEGWGCSHVLQGDPLCSHADRRRLDVALRLQPRLALGRRGEAPGGRAPGRDRGLGPRRRLRSIHCEHRQDRRDRPGESFPFCHRVGQRHVRDPGPSRERLHARLHGERGDRGPDRDHRRRGRDHRQDRGQRLGAGRRAGRYGDRQRHWTRHRPRHRRSGHEELHDRGRKSRRRHRTRRQRRLRRQQPVQAAGQRQPVQRVGGRGRLGGQLQVQREQGRQRLQGQPQARGQGARAGQPHELQHERRQRHRDRGHDPEGLKLKIAWTLGAILLLPPVAGASAAARARPAAKAKAKARADGTDLSASYSFLRSGEAHLHGADLSASFPLQRSWRLLAEGMLGGSHSTSTFSDVLSSSRTSWGGTLGGGVDYRLSSHWALRGQGDYLILHSDAGWDGDPRLSIGLTYRFSR